VKNKKPPFILILNIRLVNAQGGCFGKKFVKNLAESNPEALPACGVVKCSLKLVNAKEGLDVSKGCIRKNCFANVTVCSQRVQ